MYGTFAGSPLNAGTSHFVFKASSVPFALELRQRGVHEPEVGRALRKQRAVHLAGPELADDLRAEAGACASTIAVSSSTASMRLAFSAVNISVV